MKTITDILALFPENNYIKIESGGYMPLVIERIGTGPRGLPLVSVAHYYEQQGDLMRDPEMTFEQGTNGHLFPVSFQQDGGFAIYQEAVFQNEAGKTLVRPKLISQLKSFSKTWSGNLRNQGFLKAAKAKITNPIEHATA
jgi:hypothetical protein